MNQYHIYEAIGRGKHSVVYKGRKKKTIQYYAIKSVEKTQKSRVLQEVRTMHALDHPNVLKFYAWYETSNHLWLILEYCVGGDLMSLLRQDMRLPEASIHDFGRDLIVSLQYLHANSIIYCDLKPSNILLDENGRIKLGGFGLSRRLSDINKTPLQSLSPAKRGTPCYMAPELFQEGSTHSSASDMWALGCVLYECAAGHPPFVSTSFNQLVSDILAAEPAPLKGATPEFSNLVDRLLDKNPASRMNWAELREHPFWQFVLPERAMPEEPMLAAFILQQGLDTIAQQQPTGPRASMQAGGALAAALGGAGVDVLRLSHIVRNNLEKDSDGSGADYHAASSAGAPAGDVQLNHPDAELDFEEQAGDEGTDDEDTPSNPSHAGSESDLSGVDDSGAAPAGEDPAARAVVDVVGAVGSEQMLAAQQAQQAQHAQQRAAEASAESSAGRDGEGAGPGPDIDAVEGEMADLALEERQGSHREAESLTRPKAGGHGALQASISVTARAGGSSAVPGTSGGIPNVSRSGEGGPGVEDLIWHASDSSVKPIVCNRRIERLKDPEFDPRALPFTPFSLAEMLGASQKELEGFLTQIYRAIAGAAPLKDKVNVLAYFETLCVDTGAANVLINSSLTLLVVRMLRNARAPTLRIRLASALGLLVRHATYISDELASTGVVEVLADALRDKNERLRRRIMATLGELLFYVATQQTDGGQNSAWHVPNATIGLVARLLKPGEDEIAQHYAVKTIENIASQGGEWGTRFASQEVVYNLVQIFSSNKGENFRCTLSSTLARLLRSAPALVPYVLDKFGCKVFMMGLQDPSAKVQQAAVNMLNLALSLPDLSTRNRTMLQEERNLLPTVMDLLDSPASPLRAKAVLSLTLLTRASPRHLLEACQKLRLLPHLERLQKEKDAYLGYALGALRAEVAVAVPALTQQISAELSVSRRQSSGGTPGRASPKPVAAPQLPLVLHLLQSPALRGAVLSDQLIADLSGYLAASCGNGPASAPEFKANLLQVLEAVCAHSEVVTAHQGPVLRCLLPGLAGVVAAPAESSDTRFNCLKLLCELTLQFLSEAGIFLDADQAPSSSPEAAGARAAIDSCVAASVLPLVPGLLGEEDPMPLYALKLLGALLEAQPAWMAQVERLGLVPRFFEFLSLDHSNNNVHNIRLCRLVIGAGALSPADLQEMDVVAKVTEVLEYAHENAVEPFLEPVLQLVAALLDADNESLKAGEPGSGGTLKMAGTLPVLLELAGHPDAPLAGSAAHCCATLTAMFPEQAQAHLLCSNGLALMGAALQRDLKDGAAGAGPELQRQLLGALATACEVCCDIAATPGELLQLREIVEDVRAAAADSETSEAAANASHAIGELVS